MSYHTRLTQQDLLFFFFNAKKPGATLTSSNDTLAFQSLQDLIQKWPSLFFVGFCGSFPVFITDFVFLCFLLSAQAQLPLSCSVILPLLRSPFMCHLNGSALSHYLSSSIASPSGKCFVVAVTISAHLIQLVIQLLA